MREAKNLKRSHGIPSNVPMTNKGNKPLSEIVKQALYSFYTDSEFARVMPGTKDVVSSRNASGIKEKIAQRLILCNLSELYGHFCKTNPELLTK